MQLPLHLIDPPEPKLEDGVTGRNSAALAALGQILKTPGFSTLYLWGAPGSGKSFWLRAWKAALGGQASLINCDASAALSGGAGAGQLLAQALEQIEEPGSPRIWLLDNVDRADRATAEGLFRLYNAGRELGHCLVATADRPPLRLELRDDLRTRLGQGLIFELHELDDEEKRNALRERAEQLALPLSEDLLNYLMTRLPRDLGLLIRVLDGLNDYALSQKRPATIPLLKDLLDLPDATTRPV
ncbi:DnaA/Hda family protein [beta proteobacterium MWH-UniP1]